MVARDLSQRELVAALEELGYTIDPAPLSRFLKYGDVNSAISEYDVLVIAAFLGFNIAFAITPLTRSKGKEAEAIILKETKKRIIWVKVARGQQKTY